MTSLSLPLRREVMSFLQFTNPPCPWKKEFFFLSIPFCYYTTSYSLHKVRIETPGFIGMSEWMGFQCSPGRHYHPHSFDSKTDPPQVQNNWSNLHQGRRRVWGCEMGLLDSTASLGWNAPPKEGLILRLLCCLPQQHYHLCAAPIVYVGLAGDALWKDAHLEVCLPAYSCNFIKLLADIGLFSITDLYLWNPNESYEKEFTRV